MVRPCRCLLIFSLVKMNKFFFLTHLCTLWRRSKPFIKPPQEFVSYTGLSATFQALSRNKWTEPGFFSRRFFFWWLVVSPFPFGSFCSEKICKGYEVFLPQFFPNFNSRIHHRSFFLRRTLQNLPYSQEWPLSSVGRGTLQGGTGSNPVEVWIFLQDSQFLQLGKLQFNYEDHCSVFLIVCSFLKAS